jgi:hypothetical protein
MLLWPAHHKPRAAEAVFLQRMKAFAEEALRERGQ